MADQRRRATWYLLLVLGVVIAYTLLYDWGMSALEGEPRTLAESLGIVIETFTTTGYGEDAASWTTLQMELLMIAMQLTGVFVIFLTLPLFVAPWVERRLSTTIPTAVSDVEGHVVLCELSSRGETLIDELSSWDRDYVIVEPDRDRAESLVDAGRTVVHGDPEATATLRNARVEDAVAVVTDADDERNASVVLSVREVAEEVRVIAFAEDPQTADYLRYAGADEVFSPRHLLAEGLANEVTTAVSTQLGETVEIGSDFELVELPIQGGCEVDGSRLADSGIRERSGANVIGLWRRGEFVPAPDPETRLDTETILLVAGSESQLAALKRLTLSEVRRRARGTVIIAGFGEVGSTVGRAIASSEMEAVVVDREDRPGTDVVGDATRKETLREAGIEDATALILALSDDTTTLFATLVARELSEDLQIVARVNESGNTGKVYRAGADYVLALASVSGRMIASTLLEEEVVAPEKRIEIVRTAAPQLAGQSLAGADVRSRTGCTIIAIERDGTVLTDLPPDRVIEADDTLVVAGTDETINRFNAIAH